MKITAHIHFVTYLWKNEGQFELYSVQLDDSEFRTYVGPQEIEIDVPKNYDPRAQQIAALEKQKQKVIADFQKSVDDISERISKLQALEYVG